VRTIELFGEHKREAGNADGDWGSVSRSSGSPSVMSTGCVASNCSANEERAIEHVQAAS
jgi:hypothetical protein